MRDQNAQLQNVIRAFVLPLIRFQGLIWWIDKTALRDDFMKL